MGTTSTHKPEPLYVCDREQLGEGDCRRVEVLFSGTADSLLVLRYQGEVRAYRNLCVHMPRALDCEDGQVFDRDTGFLRCSMHGIVYSPLSGESLSDICLGKKLQAVRVMETAQGIFIRDKRIHAP